MQFWNCFFIGKTMILFIFAIVIYIYILNFSFVTRFGVFQSDTHPIFPSILAFIKISIKKSSWMQLSLIIINYLMQ